MDEENALVASAVHASNDLTSRWIDHLDLGIEEDALISGFSAWHLLSVLALGASGPAHAELEAVTQIGGRGGQPVLDAVIAELSDDIESGLGIWARDHIGLRPDFMTGHPRMTVGALTETNEHLDRWLADATAGIMSDFPKHAITEDTLAVVASALGIDTHWSEPFTDGMIRWQPEPGRWFAGLTKVLAPDAPVTTIETADATIARFVSEGGGGIDVHLVAGAAADAPRHVMEAAMAGLRGDVEAQAVTNRPGATVGCITVTESFGTEDRVVVSLPKFSLSDDRELTDTADFFGLTAALDQSTGHFPAISKFPLALQTVLQQTCAEFSAWGFRAAAASIVMMMAGGVPEGTSTRVNADFDRPFGFLVVHRASNLVLLAGWIGSTAGFEEDSGRIG